MARFVFRLQTVLEHRKRLEDLAKVAFGESQGGLFREQATLRGFREDEERTVDHLEVIQHEGILDMENLQLGLRFLDVIKVQIDRQTQRAALPAEGREAHALQERAETCEVEVHAPGGAMGLIEIEEAARLHPRLALGELHFANLHIAARKAPALKPERVSKR